MNPVSIVLLGLAMSTDAFAAALGKGAGMLKPRWPEALRIGLIFGVVEGLTPIIGWLLGSAASRHIEAWDHWIAFGILGVLGLHMIYKAATDQDATEEAISNAGADCVDRPYPAGDQHRRMAVGVGLAFVDVNILFVAVVVGLCTFTMVTWGSWRARRWAC